MRPRFRFDTRYGYAVGRLRVLDKRFLSKQLLDRLLQSRSAEEAGRVLSEGGYKGELVGTRSWEGVERLLYEEWRWTIDLIGQLSRDPFWTDLFRKRTDYHNLRVLLKEELWGVEGGELLEEGGTVSVDALRESVQSDGGEGLPPFLREPFLRVQEATAEAKDPYRVDLVLDRVEAEMWDSVLKTYPNPFLEAWRRLEVDLVNLRSFLRVRATEADPKVLGEVFLPGGTLEGDFLLDLLDEPWEEVLRVLGKTDYGELVSEAVGGVRGGEGFGGWEPACQEVRWRLLEPVRRFGFGVEVLFAFLLLKEMELSVVRRILVGRANGLTGEAIGKGVPDVFH